MYIYHADVTGQETNCLYRHRIEIVDEDSLREAVRRDYVCAEYQNGYRSKENFLGSDCVVIEFDNDHSDDPKDWVKPEQIREALPGVTMAVHYSRNHMLLKHRAKLDGATTAMEEAKARIEEEAKSRKANEIRVDELLTWAERFDEASYEAKHLVISQLVDRIEVRPNYEVDIHFRITAEQFLGKPITASA